jgi:hypothetical protein
MVEIIFIVVRCQITWRASLSPIGSLDKLLIPIGPVFQLQDDFFALITESVGVRTLTQHYYKVLYCTVILKNPPFNK